MKLFNTGLEQANLVLLSNVLRPAWKEISKLYDEIHEPSSSSSSASSLGHRVLADPKYTMISFVTPRALASEKLQQDSDMVSSIDASESFDLFGFLRRKTDFAINKASITLFHEHRDDLSRLKNQIRDRIEDGTYSKTLIITGHSLGGSIASLFTLWLLDSVDFSDKKRQICITFGSPLLGDTNLQKALCKYSPWSTNFLHVASNQDPVPRMFAIETEKVYKPFGTFLLCSESGCSCFEEPETALKLLAKTASRTQDRHPMVDYGKLVEDLGRSAVFKTMVEANWEASPYQVGTFTQLSALGLVLSPQPEDPDRVKTEIEALTVEIEKLDMKFQIGKRTVKLDKKLNDSKTYMAKLEWYMKLSKVEGIGYYDSYKNMRFVRDINVQECVKRLIIYWTDLVEEADKRPQADGEMLRTRWLFAGLNYMRIVEPLCIAEYYNHEQGLSDYEGKGRPDHFKRLEKLVAEAKDKEVAENKRRKFGVSIEEKKKRIGVSVTEDSCFWAKVEEAMVLCRSMKREDASEEEKRVCLLKLEEFESQTLGMIENYAVSPEIFLEQSSFMQWWKDYREAVGKNYASPLNDFMVNRRYNKYSKGEL